MDQPSKKTVVMIGSVPMSLGELPMAPAIISSIVKNKGHDFQFIDINLELFEQCNRNHAVYQEKTEELQIGQRPLDDSIISAWFKRVLDQISTCQYLMVSVFSQFSQATALLFIREVRQRYPDKLILIGGVGSQKLSSLSSTQLFGEFLLEAQLIDSWQTDIGTSEIERLLPQRLSQNTVASVDFGIFALYRYEWPVTGRAVPVLGSHGCVRQCSFCDVIKHFPSYSFVEADQLSQQIVSIYEQTSIPKFIFMDSLVNGSQSNFLSLLKNLQHSREQGWLPTDFSWSGTYICRPQSTLLNQIHELLPQSGVDSLTIGVETGSDRVRFEMQKKFTNQDLIHELEAFKQHGVKANLLFFASWPTETVADYAETLDLFRRLAPYGQAQVVDTVSLGTSGFVLIDGTPIDRDKDKIGLTAGPASFLWRCQSNPELTFWETIRRRLLMAEVCEYYGIKLDKENQFRRYLTINIKKFVKEILDYAGPGSLADNTEVLTKLNNQHSLFLSVVNSNEHTVKTTISVNNNPVEYFCNPGTTDIKIDFVKHYKQEETVKFNFDFGSQHQAIIGQHENGDYYAQNGIYIQQILIDQRDITLHGFNEVTKQEYTGLVPLPDDYTQHTNQRCVISNTELSWTVPGQQGLHQWFSYNMYPEEFQERCQINAKLEKIICSLN